MAEPQPNGTAAPVSKTEWYAGATRFELELEVCDGISFLDRPHQPPLPTR